MRPIKEQKRPIKEQKRPTSSKAVADRGSPKSDGGHILSRGHICLIKFLV